MIKVVIRENKRNLLHSGERKQIIRMLADLYMQLMKEMNMFGKFQEQNQEIVRRNFEDLINSYLLKQYNFQTKEQ